MGIVITTSLFLQPSDTWGRMPIVYVTNTLFILSRIAMLFVYDNYYAFLAAAAFGSGRRYNREKFEAGKTD